MKYRRFVVFCAAMILLVCCAVPAFAAGTDAKLDYVTDMTDMLTQSQWDTLEQKAESISEKYELGVYIVVLDDFKRYTDSREISQCAIEIYDSYDLGWGSDKAGTMLILSMAERDYDVDFNSSRADYVFTEAGRDRMVDRFLRYFRNNDFYGGFMEYLNTCEEYLEAAKNGNPVGFGEASSADEAEGIGFLSVIPGGIAALLTGIFMSAPMHSAGTKTDASGYEVRGSLNLRSRSDMFLHRSVTRVPRQTQSSSGGSGSHHYSSGSHSGRSGKF